MSLETPVVFFAFNRPDVTRRVFERIAAQKPARLFLIADGARNATESKLCEEVRSIITNVNWSCDVQTNFATENMGCRARLSSGISWALERSEEVIILEDDCLPHPDFFRFCSELLARYRTDERVFSISGDNFQRESRGYSYYFSRYPHVWGWATWRRAWQKYDVDLASWPELSRNHSFRELVKGPAGRYWARNFDLICKGFNTWDIQWTFACLLNQGLTILPDKNLVSNIGFGAEATHTKRKSPLEALGTTELDWPLRHPPFVARNEAADEFTEHRVFRVRPVDRLIYLARQLWRYL